MLLSIPFIAHLIFSQVNTRVHEDLLEELEAFDLFQKQQFPEIDNLDQDQISQLFQEFLNYKIPEDDTFLITIIDDQFYRSNPVSRPAILAIESPLMQHLQTLEKPTQGEWMSSETEIETSRILYLAKPIIVKEEVKGIFVAVHITGGEIQEAIAAVQISITVLLVFLLIAAFAAWVASGKVLNPLQKLSQAVSSIDESNLEHQVMLTGTTGSGEIAQLSKSFNQMMHRLHTVFLSQRELLNDVGHELRTPITIIRGHLELMGNDPQEQEETLAIVFDELDRMNRLVNNLILLAKAERFDFLQEETIDVAQFTQEIYTKIITLAQRDWQLNNQGRGFFQGDRQRLTQAIINLAQNAVQHTEQSDRIILGSKTDQDSVYVWLLDTGKGFTPEEQELIFQRFARGRNSLGRTEGQGLGLSIVQAIVQAHRGRVKARGKLGKGATFTLILPLDKS